MMRAPCQGCGGMFSADRPGATHPYMLGSAGCWATYGEVLAREYEQPPLFQAVHRLTVDAYAVQHPGDPDDRRARQSVWIHAAALFVIFERGADHAEARKLLSALAHREFPLLPAHQPFAITTAEVAAAPPARHVEMVEAWARDAHRCWAGLRPDIIALLG
ncbi:MULTISPECIES: DUF5946 family protein [unclassified Sphingomonas]|uniref:DUF5946 family protein n=2 Tax=Sphingomonas TaxID=13687 RepID=UPI00083155AC